MGNQHGGKFQKPPLNKKWRYEVDDFDYEI